MPGNTVFYQEISGLPGNLNSLRWTHCWFHKWIRRVMLLEREELSREEEGEEECVSVKYEFSGKYGPICWKR
jgi:hypothetical protein